MTLFKGFPYMVTKILAAMYHIILLPADRSEEELKLLAHRQIAANKLFTCLVIKSDRVLYLDSDGGEIQSTEPPKGTIFVSEKLKAAENLAETEELRQRKAQLKIFTKTMEPQTGYLLGDLNKGGRVASEEELLRLKGKQENGVPKGLTRCSKCHDWRGECLDPSLKFKDILMRVYCLCENDNLCARCGRPLFERKLNANCYHESDNGIWHVPGFSGLSHQCLPDA